MKLTLKISDQEYSIYKLSEKQFEALDCSRLPTFFSLCKSESEISFLAPSQLPIAYEKAEKGWAMFAIVGELPFTMTGVLSSILGPLGVAKISILAVSTFDTDFIFVKKEKLLDAIGVLRAHGFLIHER